MSKMDTKQGDYRALLHEAGFKATPARLALLALFKKTGKPLSIKYIQEHLGTKDTDQATIYRMINALEQSDVVKYIDLKHGHGHYELVSPAHHHHIVCEKCGKIQDVSCDTKALQAKILKSSGFSKINDHSLEFFGICKSCAKTHIR
jgi:Fur family ferric uptake transcriptional regulator